MQQKPRYATTGIVAVLDQPLSPTLHVSVVPIDEAVRALDAVHASARDAFMRLDAAGAVALFSPILVYHGVDGRIFDRAALARDVATQLGRMHRASSTFTRESLDVAADGKSAVEVLNQEASFEVVAFGLLHRVWSITRRARYGWSRTDAGWQVIRVEVLAEQVHALRTWLSFK